MTAQRQEKNGSCAGLAFRPGIAAIAILTGLLGQFSAPRPGFRLRPGPRPPNGWSSTVLGSGHRRFRPGRLFRQRQSDGRQAGFRGVRIGRGLALSERGNRASFVAHPDIYGPQFGGYDPIDVARGVTYAGNPRFWLITGERLYLFGREQHRDLFAADPERFLRQATTRWPQLEQDLAQ